MKQQFIGINLNVLPRTQEEAIKIIEVLSRAATGLALEGISVSLGITPYEGEEED
jgi:hypothetical protein